MSESNLHKSLKLYYKGLYKDSSGIEPQLEVPIANYICDIVCQKQVVEIQTQRLEKLTPKIAYLLSLGYRVKVVLPIVTKRLIAAYSEEGKLLYTKSSTTRKWSLYSIAYGLYKLWDLLSNSALEVELVYCSVKEVKTKLLKAYRIGKTKPRYRRFRLIDCYLSAIQERKRLEECLNDYSLFLGKGLPTVFSAADILSLLAKKPKSIELYSIIKLLLKAKVIKEVAPPTKTRTRYYTLVLPREEEGAQTTRP